MAAAGEHLPRDHRPVRHPIPPVLGSPAALVGRARAGAGAPCETAVRVAGEGRGGAPRQEAHDLGAGGGRGGGGEGGEWRAEVGWGEAGLFESGSWRGGAEGCEGDAGAVLGGGRWDVG